MADNRYKNSAIILAIIGAPGSGKTTAADYLASQGIPRVRHEYNDFCNTTDEVILEIKNLISAGQRTLVLDDIVSVEEYRRLKHEFVGCIKVIARYPAASIIASR